MFRWCSAIRLELNLVTPVHSDMQAYYKAHVWALLPSTEILDILCDLFAHNRAAATPDGRVLFTDVSFRSAL